MVDFIEAVNGRVIDYETNGNVIKSVTLSVFTPPDNELLKEYGFKWGVIDDLYVCIMFSYVSLCSIRKRFIFKIYF